jgi:hypothetical protein
MMIEILSVIHSKTRQQINVLIIRTLLIPRNIQTKKKHTLPHPAVKMIPAIFERNKIQSSANPSKELTTIVSTKSVVQRGRRLLENVIRRESIVPSRTLIYSKHIKSKSDM